MFDIQLNESGTRHLKATEDNMRTIRTYRLFEGLIGSDGYVTEEALEKLRLTTRALIVSHAGDTKPLLDLCIDVVYHDKMKAFGLRNLIAAYREWEAAAPAETAADAEAPAL